MSHPQDPYGPPPQGAYPRQPQQSQHPQYPQQPQGGGMPPYAGWGSRAGAYLLDSLIVGLVPMILIGIGYAQVIGALIDAAGNCPIGDTVCAQNAAEIPGSAWPLIIVGVLLSLAGQLWLIHREGRTGQTPGKKALRISLLREADGQPLGFGMAFVRKLAHILDGAACYIGYLWPLWDGKKQTFADKVVNSVVVKQRQ
ncbi:RDD family protein [Streptomyces sp. CNQ085]|uniref:RDD family protein n=1 Tax=Streptomyces sp. CNQ085 TaxID=2886944 RepID=UPI001F50FF92|nr:RDD family protein [Streptomyces sp. CNQ085]MCI0386435.1 RDD family protein [Streptomyces sp. CNQ085]